MTLKYTSIRSSLCDAVLCCLFFMWLLPVRRLHQEKHPATALGAAVDCFHWCTGLIERAMSVYVCCRKHRLRVLLLKTPYQHGESQDIPYRKFLPLTKLRIDPTVTVQVACPGLQGAELPQTGQARKHTDRHGRCRPCRVAFRSESSPHMLVYLSLPPKLMHESL